MPRHKPIPAPSPVWVKRFYSRLERTPRGCWEWTGSKDGKGYGTVGLAKQTYRTHRVSFRIQHGVDPGDLLVCHTCDNPSCINPDHLWLGTVLDNAHDMIAKGRRRFGAPRKPDWMHPDWSPPHCKKCGHLRTDDIIEKPRRTSPIRRCRPCANAKKRRHYHQSAVFGPAR